METYIRKTLGMKAHWVTEVVETEEGWLAGSIDWEIVV